MKPDDFPSLRAIPSTPAQFDAAVEQIAEGIAAGSIRNVDLQDAKFTLSRIVEKAWKTHVSNFFYGGDWERYPYDLQDLHAGIRIMGLHDVIAASKKVAKTKVTGPIVDAMRAYCDEVLPLAQAVALLKNKVVKGRVPRQDPVKPENPNKVIGTCPVCFRSLSLIHI